MVGGRMVHVKSEESDTLLDAMLTEGMADAFAQEIYPDRLPRWVTELSPDDVESDSLVVTFSVTVPADFPIDMRL